MRRSRKEILIWTPKYLLGFLSKDGPSTWEPGGGGRKTAPPKPSEDCQSSLHCFPKATPLRMRLVDSVSLQELLLTLECNFFNAQQQ